MRKLISVVLAALLLLTICSVALAAASNGGVISEEVKAKLHSGGANQRDGATAFLGEKLIEKLGTKQVTSTKKAAVNCACGCGCLAKECSCGKMGQLPCHLEKCTCWHALFD